MELYIHTPIRLPDMMLCSLSLLALRFAETGRAMAQAVSRRPLMRRPEFSHGPVCVGFVVDRLALGRFLLHVHRFYPLSFRQSSVLQFHSSDGDAV